MFGAVTSSARQDGDASGQEGEREYRGSRWASGEHLAAGVTREHSGLLLSLRREGSEVTRQRGDFILAPTLGMCS